MTVQLDHLVPPPGGVLSTDAFLVVRAGAAAPYAVPPSALPGAGGDVAAEAVLRIAGDAANSTATAAEAAARLAGDQASGTAIAAEATARAAAVSAEATARTAADTTETTARLAADAAEAATRAAADTAEATARATAVAGVAAVASGAATAADNALTVANAAGTAATNAGNTAASAATAAANALAAANSAADSAAAASTVAAAALAAATNVASVASLPAELTIDPQQIIPLFDKTTGQAVGQTTISNLLAQIQSGSAPSITLVMPTGVQPGASFTIGGSYLNDGTSPVLTISVDGGAFTALPTGSTVASGSVSLMMPGLAAGSHTVQVKDSNGVLSNVVTFSIVAPETLTVTTPGAQVTGTAFTASGGYANGTPPSLDYTLDNGATWTSAVSPVISGGTYSFSVTATVANASAVLKVRDHTQQSIVGTSGTFAITAPAAGLQPNLTMTGASYGTGKFGQALTGGKGVATFAITDGDFAVACWVRADATPVQDFQPRPIVAINGNLGLVLNENNPGCAGLLAGPSGSVNVCDGAWHHLVIQHSLSRGGMQLYVDGVVATGAGTSTAVGSTPIITIASLGGLVNVPSQNNAPGYVQVDNVAFYSGYKFPFDTPFTPPTTPGSRTDAMLVGLYNLDGTGASA